ncbi:hypothetical protein [Streptomyces sp. NPDC058572]|uniref:hypothetical protein n=1 Tax=Streptomyces sp. NPDC058572 TaxID=3346546 RepID=UPI00365D836E
MFACPRGNDEGPDARTPPGRPHIDEAYRVFDRERAQGALRPHGWRNGRGVGGGAPPSPARDL